MTLFKQVKLLTPESVELEFTLAGIGSRALALVIDYTLLALGQTLLWTVVGLFSEQLTNYLDRLGVNYSSLPLWLLSLVLLGSVAIFGGYFVAFEVLWQGQSPGKRWTKIRVIRDNGQPVGIAQATLRAMLRPVDDFCFIGAFLISLTQSEKRLGDWVAGTLVVQEKAAQPASLALSETARQLAPDLPPLTQLEPDDFAVVSEYLHRRSTMTIEARSELSLKLAREIRAIIALGEIPAGLTSDQFLEAVYLAYQQQFSV
jgi:uncharacterized RDD family membrane protein YckC